MQSIGSPSSREALLNALSATEDDLAVNRQGLLSSKQKAEMQKLPSFGEAIFVVFLPLVIGTLVFLPVYFAVKENPNLFLEALSFSDGNTVMGALFTIFFAGLGFYLIRLAVLAIANPLRLRKSNVVKGLEGTVSIKVKRMRKSPAVFYELHIQGQSFFILPSICPLIQEGSQYRVFYEPIQKQIVSMEAIDESTAA